MWNVFLENLIPTVFTIVTPLVTYFVSIAMQKLSKRWHLENVIKYNERVNALILQGIQAVEQRSMAAVKKGGEKTSGEQKLDEVMKFVNAQLAEMKLPQKAAGELAMIVEAHLFNGAKAGQNSNKPLKVDAPAAAPLADSTPASASDAAPDVVNG